MAPTFGLKSFLLGTIEEALPSFPILEEISYCPGAGDYLAVDKYLGSYSLFDLGKEN